MKKPCGNGTGQFIAAILLILIVVGSGCRSVRRGEPIQGRLNVSDPKVAHGQQVFAHKCSMCHPGGEGGLGPALNNLPYPGWAIKTQVRHGFGVMPKFDPHVLPPEDLDAVVAYALANRRHDLRPVR